MLRGIADKLQERPLDGLSNSITRKLERLTLDSQASDAQKPAHFFGLRKCVGRSVESAVRRQCMSLRRRVPRRKRTSSVPPRYHVFVMENIRGDA
ncbi:MAG: hypothetical protein CR217_15695 [Beijerinckiaceae bacterium]|nr:MAG: hypothetical protein CR217_15695 [Beijerinckiaceae bacterium]